MSNLDKQRIASPQKGNGIEVMVLAAVGLRAPGDVIGAIRAERRRKWIGRGEGLLTERRFELAQGAEKGHKSDQI